VGPADNGDVLMRAEWHWSDVLRSESVFALVKQVHRTKGISD
jgi:hypothetical protein